MSVCDQFSPPTDDSYQTKPLEMEAAPLIDESVASRRRLVELPRLQETVRLFSKSRPDATVSADGLLEEQIGFDSNSFVRSSTTWYKFTLENSDPVAPDSTSLKYEGETEQVSPSVSLKLNLKEKVIPAQQFIATVYNVIKLNPKVKVFQRGDLLDEIQNRIKVSVISQADKVTTIPSVDSQVFREQSLDTILQ